MKTKPTRHKETNTFKFKPFSERISEIDVDVFHRVSHRNEDDSEVEETYFHEALQKWNVLNLSESYCSFKKEVRNIVTLPQLLNSKQHVVDTLMKYLKMKDVLSLQPILELVVAVARDLQKDFYEYFPEFLAVITSLLNTKDAEQLEHAFTALAYLFKFLWRYLIRNVDAVFDLLLPLLADSRPVYINNFAAESFSFVVRKVKDKDGFLRLILNNLRERPGGTQGCGKLLYEVVSGVPGQFHSCAEQMLTLYFQALQDESIDQKLLYKVLEQILNNILTNIQPQRSEILWSVLIKMIEKFSENNCQARTNRESGLALIMKLALPIVTFNGGKMLTNPIPFVKTLVQVIDEHKQEEEILQTVVKVSIAVLLGPNVKLTQETSCQLALKVLSVDSTDFLYKIIEELIHYSSFEALVLPHILQTIDARLDSKALRLLSKIIEEKSPPCLNGVGLSKWNKFTLDVRHLSPETITYLEKELTSLSTPNATEDSLRILIILPHLSPKPKILEAVLLRETISLHENLLASNAQNDTEELKRFRFSFLLAMETVIHILEPSVLHKFLQETNISVCNLARKFSDSEIVLNFTDLFLTSVSELSARGEYVNRSTFEALHECIAPMLGSPFHHVRLIAAHIYSLFKTVEVLRISEGSADKNAFELPLLAESRSASIQKYRDKLLHLEALSYQCHATVNLRSKYHGFPLRYLIGNLYVNFSLIWDPVCKIIATYAHKECSQFWEIFLSELTSERPSVRSESASFECDVLSKIQERLSQGDDKPDHENYKLLLWKCMSYFPEFCEVKNRDITGLFVGFVESNFFRCNSEEAKSCDIAIHSRKLSAIENTEEEDIGEDETEASKASEQAKSRFGSRLRKIKLLLGQMEVFSKMSNPRMLHRASEVENIYLELLSSRNVEIQKAALNCLLSYRHKYILPYKEQLQNLVDEKNLKSELIRFRIDQDSEILQEEHREELMPLVMRIIYAKMATRTGTRTGGKGGGLVRRKAVLRFLAGSRENEMLAFSRMAFGPLLRFLPKALDEDLDLKSLIKDVIEKTDLQNVVPPKRLQSTVNLLSIIIEQFGGNMEKLLPRLLGLLICILAQVVGVLKRAGEVHPGFLPSIRNVRTSCVAILARFFSHFENFGWTADQLDALFEVAVFPWVEKLPMEGIHSPTALLKLFSAWSQNPRYFPLFIKHQEASTEMTPLPFVMRLLCGPRTQPSVINAILEILLKLLTLQEDPDRMDVDLKAAPLDEVLRNCLVVPKTAIGVNFGSAILLPHVPAILEYVKRKLIRTKRVVNKTELTILSRISELVSDPDSCDALLTLVLPILVKKAGIPGADEAVLDLVTTAANLVKRVKRPEKHLRLVVPLVGTVSNIPARKILLEIFQDIAERSGEDSRKVLKANCEVLVDLNAWDRKWVEQPDFQKRLDAFSGINGLLEEERVSLEFGVAVIHNCFFFLKHETDLALRDSSGQCLKTLGPKLAQRFKADNRDRLFLVEENVLAIIRSGIRSKNEVVRMQSIAFLGRMAMECPDVHPVFRDLSPLADKLDPEVDFFENSQHLQLHRRARALLKFCSVAGTLKKTPNPKTLTHFVLPLASNYLCNDAFAKKNSLVDASIDTLGVVSRLLPWQQYEVLLRFYLDKLKSSTEHQRQIVRIVVAILDGFHYDLGKFKEKPEGQVKVSPPGKPEKPPGDAEDAVQEEEEEEEDASLEKLDEALDAKEPKGEEVAKEDGEDAEELPAVKKELVLSQSAARRVVFGISKGLLPQLHRAIVARTRHETSHKVNRKRTGAEREEEEMVRVPIALALVKLLQKLPGDALDKNLPGVLMKICTFLKSRLDSVRRITREILQKIMITLGPDYLHHLLTEMNGLLTKGFQVHVLVYTIHAVMVSLKPYLKPVHVNQNLQSLLSVCKVDLFGLTAEEKEVAGIVKNVSEAKSTKSYDIFHILAQFISESCLLDLTLPLKEVLTKTHSYKTVRKAVECLRQIVLGLADNTFIPTERMLIFLYGVVSESIPDLGPEKSEPISEQEARIKARQNPDCFIIPKEPKSRMGVKQTAKTSRNTNAHVMVEFGLRLCHIFLKRERVSNQEFRPYLDPFVEVLSECLKAQHVKLSTLALQCLGWILKMSLPSLKKAAPEICSSLFGILHKYAAAGLSKGDNFDLVVASFKCVSVLVRDVKDFRITVDQLKILLLYAEQDLHDTDKQATAFGLLKAIINRKLIVPEIHGVMHKVAKLSVTSDLDHVRQQARSVFYTFLMEYPIGNQLVKHLSFFLTQLGFEVQQGRLSALEMIHNVVTGFPVEVLSEHSEVLFLMVGARLVNDDDPTCRKLCAKCLKEMLIRIPHNQRTKLFTLVAVWFKDKKLVHRRLAAQLCGIFATAEKEKFDSRLSQVLPLILKQFHHFEGVDKTEVGRYVKSLGGGPKRGRSAEEVPEKVMDHYIFQVMQLLLKISANCPKLLNSKKHQSFVSSFAEHSQSLLAHPHLWVRLASTQMIGFILAALDVKRVVELLENPEKCTLDDGYMYSDPMNTIKTLSLDLIAQLHPDMMCDEFADQVVKNLIFISRLLRSVKPKLEDTKETSNEDEHNASYVSLIWFVKRLRKAVNMEVAQAPKSISVRTAVFKLFAGMVTAIPMEYLEPVLLHVMSPLVREISTTEESNAPLRHLAKDAARMIKKKLDAEEYTRLLRKVQQRLDMRRAERKRTRTQQFVTDPELAAKRKIARQQKKKEAKKRKMDVMKGKKTPRKKPKKEVNLEEF
ncbi:small subunit processome component 20 homolog [Orussus abietinus]|uniref:small subunit processome component 20 homolog n=1 Tax=Orussus abietinus TaxID=222816 RepID=UPI000626D618|nr:small subunit processome component 20 homolog [Orussus abietinus]